MLSHNSVHERVFSYCIGKVLWQFWIILHFSFVCKGTTTESRAELLLQRSWTTVNNFWCIIIIIIVKKVQLVLPKLQVWDQSKIFNGKLQMYFCNALLFSSLSSLWVQLRTALVCIMQVVGKRTGAAENWERSPKEKEKDFEFGLESAASLRTFLFGKDWKAFSSSAKNQLVGLLQLEPPGSLLRRSTRDLDYFVPLFSALLASLICSFKAFVCTLN